MGSSKSERRIRRQLDQQSLLYSQQIAAQSSAFQQQLGFQRQQATEYQNRAKIEREALAKQTEKIRVETETASANYKNSQKKFAQSQARANRARIRGGLFGEGQPQTPLSARLG